MHTRPVRIRNTTMKWKIVRQNANLARNEIHRIEKLYNVCIPVVFDAEDMTELLHEDCSVEDVLTAISLLQRDTHSGEQIANAAADAAWTQMEKELADWIEEISPKPEKYQDMRFPQDLKEYK